MELDLLRHVVIQHAPIIIIIRNLLDFPGWVWASTGLGLGVQRDGAPAGDGAGEGGALGGVGGGGGSVGRVSSAEAAAFLRLVDLVCDLVPFWMASEGG